MKVPSSESLREMPPQWTPSIRPVMDMSNPASCECCQELQIQASAGLSPQSEALRLAGSQVSTTGRFWVSTEGCRRWISPNCGATTGDRGEADQAAASGSTRSFFRRRSACQRSYWTC